MRSTALLVMILLRAITVLSEIPMCDGESIRPGQKCVEAVPDGGFACKSYGENGKLERKDGKLICHVTGARWEPCNGERPKYGGRCEEVVTDGNIKRCLVICDVLSPKCFPEIKTFDDGTTVCLLESLWSPDYDSLLSDQLKLNEYIKSRSFPTIAPFIVRSKLTDVQSVALLPLYARITEVNEKAQAISVMMVVIMSWTDNRLMWNASDFGGITELTITRDSIWRPPITPMNLISFVTDDALKPNLLLESTGQLTDMAIWNFRIAVDMHFKNFPFDRQTFFLTLKAFSGYRLQGTDYILTKSDTENEWHIVEDFERMPSDDTKELTYKVTMKRYPYFWINLIILPCFILGFLVVAAMTLGADSNSIEALVNIGLAASVASAVVVTAMVDNFPKTEKVPSLATFVLSQFVIIVTVLITLAIRRALMTMVDAALEAWQNDDHSTVASKNQSGRSKNAEEIPSRMEKAGSMQTRVVIVKCLKHRLFLFGIFGIAYMACFASMMRHVDLNFAKKKQPDWLYAGDPNFSLLSAHKGQ